MSTHQLAHTWRTKAARLREKYPGDHLAIAAAVALEECALDLETLRASVPPSSVSAVVNPSPS